jgi:MFS family permease
MQKVRSTAAARPRQRGAVFDAFQHVYFRWFWLGRLASSATMEMGTVAQGWLAYQLTGSALALGWVSSARSVARLLLSLYGGALADRIERRKLLIWTRAGMLVNALGIAVLIMTGTVQVWHLVLYSFLAGVISSLMMPAQQAFLSDLVDRKTLMNAVSLTSVGRGLVGIFGASVAGFIIEWVGVESVYFVIAGLYILALYTLTRLPLGSNDAVRQSSLKSSMWTNLREGLRYLKACPPLVPLLAASLVRVLLGWSYRTLMPVYAEEVLHFDARGLGILSAAPNVGALLGSLGLASLGDYQGKGKIMIGAGLMMGLALVAFANVPYFGLVLVLLVIAGVGRNAGMILNQTLLQLNCTDEFRGRVMAVYMMLMGLMPLGTIPAGAIADAWGAPLSITLQGALMAAIFAAFWVGKSKLRELP